MRVRVRGHSEVALSDVFADLAVEPSYYRAMSLRRRRNRDDSADAPSGRLWLELRWSFEDEDGGRYASPDVGFDDLTGADILRVWDYMRSRAASISPREVWDRNNEPADESLALADAIVLLARGELGYVSVVIDDLQPRRLPPLVLELWSDAASMYWWVNDHGWNAETAAELAELLGQLHALLPQARLAYEEPSPVEEFWGPVNTYLTAIR